MALAAVIPLNSDALAARRLAEYEAARDALAQRWPNVGVEDLRAVVVAFDRFAEAFGGSRRP